MCVYLPKCTHSRKKAERWSLIPLFKSALFPKAKSVATSKLPKNISKNHDTGRRGRIP
jgi:hypothetical protein